MSKHPNEALNLLPPTTRVEPKKASQTALPGSRTPASPSSPEKQGGLSSRILAQNSAEQHARPANITISSSETPDITSPADFPALGPSTPALPTRKPKMTFPIIPGRNKTIKSAPGKGPAVAKAPKVQPPEPRAVVVEIRVRETLDTNESVQACARFPLRTLNARLGYFEEKFTGHAETTTALATDNADIVEILPWTMDAEAMKCVLEWIRHRRDSDPDTPPQGPPSQLLTWVSKNDHSLTCVCRRKATTSIDPFHRAKLYRAAGLLRLIGDAASQSRLEADLLSECKSHHTDAQGANCYNQHVNQILSFCWNEVNTQWTNSVFIHKLLAEIVEHLEQIDGNKPPATMNAVLNGASQRSFLLSTANVVTLNSDYQTACNSYFTEMQNKDQEKQAYEKRKQRREARGKQQGSSGGSGQHKGRGPQAQQSGSKIVSMSQEAAEKLHGRRGMGGS
ncbi:hypothetical protein FKW77_007444 [Venturia effusa]|uniref:Uncharacterized protein n=1 Tax=Venturia effusa TaxID=50376 RepID=A0A517KZQ4_9PEZI|nr:hypothetical protein FKW77_007444 [Venturia effusa]